MSEFNIAEARTRFSELVRKAMLGEEVIIARDNRPLIRLVPIAAPSGDRQPGSARGKVLHVADDFEVPLADFAEYR